MFKLWSITLILVFWLVIVHLSVAKKARFDAGRKHRFRITLQKCCGKFKCGNYKTIAKSHSNSSRIIPLSSTKQVEMAASINAKKITAKFPISQTTDEKTVSNFISASESTDSSLETSSFREQNNDQIVSSESETFSTDYQSTTPTVKSTTLLDQNALKSSNPTENFQTLLETPSASTSLRTDENSVLSSNKVIISSFEASLTSIVTSSTASISTRLDARTSSSSIESTIGTENTDFTTKMSSNFISTTTSTTSSPQNSTSSVEVFTTTSTVFSTTLSPSPQNSTSTALVNTTTTKITTIKPTTPRPTTISPTVSCPSTCIKDNSLFRADGTLLDPEYHGFWTTACGELYVFGKTLANWTQNVAMCCRLGMQPLALESKEKSDCFNKFVDGVNWRYNSRYWTSGIRYITPTTNFTWCNTSGIFDKTFWSRDEPDNANRTEYCLRLVISKFTSRAQLEDKHCGTVAAFACQGITTPKPPCTAPSCPNITCAKNMKLFKYLKDNTTYYLDRPEQYGTWVEIDHRSYLFSNAMNLKNFTEALSFCCSIGRKLLSLHQNFNYDNLVRALKKGNLSADKFWTSGTDQGCTSNYGYCSTNRLVRKEARWKSGQPDNLVGNEHCLSVDVSASSAELSDVTCDSKFRIICEGRVRSRYDGIESECAAAFNLTQAVVKALSNTTPSTLPEKCFLKCVGEGLDLFINGKLVEEKLISQFNSISAGDVKKLMDMYSTINMCTNNTRGMDECDKASSLLRCGIENAPDAVSKLMQNLELQINEPALYMSANDVICPAEFSCVVDDSLKYVFDIAPNNSFYNSTNALYRKFTYGCNKKFLFLKYFTPLPYIQAYEICCQYGLRLVTIETKEKFDCMVNIGVHLLFKQEIAFLTSATRLNNQPRWCFSSIPFDRTMAQDLMDASTNHLIMFSFDPPYYFANSSQNIMAFGCETIN